MRKPTMFDKFLSAVRDVLAARGHGVEELASHAPRGFWGEVGKLTGQITKTANGYWIQNKEPLLAELRKDEPHGGDVVPVPTGRKLAKVDTPATDKVDKAATITREEVAQMMDALESRLTTLIDDRLDTDLKAKSAMAFDKPPRPPKEGKKFIGSKDDVRAVVDSQLFKRLKADADTNFNGNLSATLDAILWNFYQRPKLSFE